MKTITIEDKVFVPFLEERIIQEKIKILAQQIDEDYANKQPLFIAILNGSFMFSSDLFKKITVCAEISFIKLASYKGIKSSGQVITAIGLDAEIKDRHIILLEDIIETGTTLNSFLPQLQHQSPASLKIATLLHKPSAGKFPINVDYCCFSIPNNFVLGYGLDYNGFGRNSADIYRLQSE